MFCLQGVMALREEPLSPCSMGFVSIAAMPLTSSVHCTGARHAGSRHGQRLGTHDQEAVPVQVRYGRTSGPSALMALEVACVVVALGALARP